MLNRVLRLVVLVICLLLCRPISATTVRMNTDSARAVLEAIQNPALSHDEALKIAQMSGNQGVIQKLQEFKIPAASESFANALYKTAHGEKITDATENSYLFFLVQPKSLQLLNLLKQIQANPKEFQGAIEQRIAAFTPRGSDVHLEGYIVAAGDGGGYAFGGTDFYLNIGLVDEFIVAKSVTTHELYHAVQGAFAGQRKAAKDDPRKTSQERACSEVNRLFASLYREGSAVYVADPSILSEARSSIGVRIRDDMSDGMKHIRTSVSLLEMSVVSLSAEEALPYDSVYEVGFLGHGTLYNIAYAMAKAITDDTGPQGLAALLKQPSYEFLLRYSQLPKYGRDEAHPKLGPQTLVVAKQLAAGCK